MSHMMAYFLEKRHNFTRGALGGYLWGKLFGRARVNRIYLKVFALFCKTNHTDERIRHSKRIKLVFSQFLATVQAPLLILRRTKESRF
jgi:hypothetical protein